MKVCIYGAGAIGGFIGARLALAGDCQVSAVARGATLAALREHGLRLRQGGSLLHTPLVQRRRPGDAGPAGRRGHAVKGPALAAVAARIAPLLGPDTWVLPAMNGVPWWFGAGRAGAGRCAAGEHRPGRPHRRGHSRGAGDRLRGACQHLDLRARAGRAQDGAGPDHRRAGSAGHRPACRRWPACCSAPVSTPRPRPMCAGTSGTSCGAT